MVSIPIRCTSTMPVDVHLFFTHTNICLEKDENTHTTTRKKQPQHTLFLDKFANFVRTKI